MPELNKNVLKYKKRPNDHRNMVYRIYLQEQFKAQILKTVTSLKEK